MAIIEWKCLHYPYLKLKQLNSYAKFYFWWFQLLGNEAYDIDITPFKDKNELLEPVTNLQLESPLENSLLEVVSGKLQPEVVVGELHPEMPSDNLTYVKSVNELKPEQSVIQSGMDVQATKEISEVLTINPITDEPLNILNCNKIKLIFDFETIIFKN